MRRILGFWNRQGGREQMRPVEAWRLSAEQRRRLLGVLSEIGVGIVSEARGPVPLLSFGRRVLERLEGGRADGAGGVPLPHFADALKRVIGEMADERLRVMSPTDFLGVGYVYNARDPETFPIRSSR
jgi:hypothetical protein